MSTVPRDSSRFDPNVNDRSTPQQKLVNIMRRMVKEGKKELRVCLPGKVVALHNNYSADIQPLLQSQYESSATPVTLPILPDVPISMPAGASFAVQYPISVNDTGILIFADRSLDAWLAGTGGLVDPQDARLHDLTDAIFLPSLLPTATAQALADSSGDLVLQNGLAHVRVKANGHVAIGNASHDLAAQVQTLANQVAALAQAIGSMPAINGKPVDPQAVSIAAQAQDVAAALGSIASG